jgi:hypothetical protein
LTTHDDAEATWRRPDKSSEESTELLGLSEELKKSAVPLWGLVHAVHYTNYMMLPRWGFNFPSLTSLFSVLSLVRKEFSSQKGIHHLRVVHMDQHHSSDAEILAMDNNMDNHDKTKEFK